MARMARVYLPNTAQLVMVRGINQAHVFHSQKDVEHWQAIMRSIVPSHGVAVHAFAQLDHAVYLLVSAEHDKALGKLMQDLGRRYVHHINSTQNRTGTLWEGRYRTAYLQDTHILNAYTWLDTLSHNSSRAHHEGVNALSFISEHEQYWLTGNTPFDRQSQHRQRCTQGISTKTSATFAQAVFTGWALGDAEFLARANLISGQRVTKAARGRPRKVIEPS